MKTIWDEFAELVGRVLAERWFRREQSSKTLTPSAAEGPAVAMKPTKGTPPRVDNRPTARGAK